MCEIFRKLFEKARSSRRAFSQKASGENFRSAYFDDVVKNIEAYGWHLTYVSSGDGEGPSFGYTVGFPKTLGAPELICFGLPDTIVHHMFWEMFSQIKAGEIVEDGKRWSGLLQGHDCITRKAVHSDLFEEYTLSSDWFWKESGRAGHPDVYQLVWPGKQDGLFPWNENCSASVIDAQTRLWTDG